MSKPVIVGGKYYKSKREAAQGVNQYTGNKNNGYGYEKQLQQKRPFIEGLSVTYL